MEETLKRTPLYETHLKYGEKIVPFSGWEMPVQYKAGVIKEHMAVRTACGVFDVSHMGEVLCKGPGALQYLNYLLTNDFTNLAAGQARYSPMCNEEGGIVDDLIVYKKDEEEYLIVINAGNIDKDYQWMVAHKTDDIELDVVIVEQREHGDNVPTDPPEAQMVHGTADQTGGVAERL